MGLKEKLKVLLGETFKIFKETLPIRKENYLFSLSLLDGIFLDYSKIKEDYIELSRLANKDLRNYNIEDLLDKLSDLIIIE